MCMMMIRNLNTTAHDQVQIFAVFGGQSEVQGQGGEQQ